MTIAVNRWNLPYRRQNLSRAVDASCQSDIARLSSTQGPFLASSQP